MGSGSIQDNRIKIPLVTRPHTVLQRRCAGALFVARPNRKAVSIDGNQDGAKAQGANEQAGGGSQAETPSAKDQEPNVPTVDAEAYKAALAERDAQIAELEKTIAEAARTAENAERLRAAGDAQRIEFELKLAGGTTGLEPAGAAADGEETELKR